MEHLMDLSHIVVATSLSSHTAAVYAQGVRLARAVGAKITLAHVDGTIRWRLPGLEMVRAYIEERQAITLGMLERDRDALRDAGVDAEMAIVSEHSVWRGLLELTSELGADLIVAGRGPDAPGLGTTAKRLARHAEVPLLLCSEGEPRNLDQLPAIEHVVAATDLSAISDLGARAAFDFARRVGAKLTLAHVVTPYASLLRDDSAVTQRAMAQLEAALRESAGARLEVLAA